MFANKRHIYTFRKIDGKWYVYIMFKVPNYAALFILFAIIRYIRQRVLNYNWLRHIVFKMILYMISEAINYTL